MPFPWHYAIQPNGGDLDVLESVPLPWEPSDREYLKPADKKPRISGKAATKGQPGVVLKWREVDEATWAHLVSVTGMGDGEPSRTVLLRIPIHANTSGTPRWGDYRGIADNPEGGDHSAESLHKRVNVSVRVRDLSLQRIAP